MKANNEDKTGKNGRRRKQRQIKKTKPRQIIKTKLKKRGRRTQRKTK